MVVLLSDLICQIFHFFDTLMLLILDFVGIAKKCHYGIRVALHKLFISRDDMHQYIDEPHRKDHQQSDHNFFRPPYLWNQVSGVYYIPPSFWFPTLKFWLSINWHITFVLYTLNVYALRNNFLPNNPKKYRTKLPNKFQKYI